MVCLVMQIDDLAPIRNSFFLGAYNKVLQDLQSQPGWAQHPEAKLFGYRALLAQGKYDAVLNGIQPSRDLPALAALHLLAKYLSNANRPAVEEEIQRLLESGSNSFDPAVQVSAATVFFMAGDYEKALKVLSKSPRDLEWLNSLSFFLFQSHQQNSTQTVFTLVLVLCWASRFT